MAVPHQTRRGSDHRHALNHLASRSRDGRSQTGVRPARAVRPPKDGPHGIIDRELDEAIRKYQEDRDLRVDAWMRPGGETATRLSYDLALLDD